MAEEGWSQLPSDLLALILEQFTTADRSRFRSVCVDWSSAPQQMRPADIPWLMLPPYIPKPGPPVDGDDKKSGSDQVKPKDGKRCSIQKYMRFYSISEKRTYNLGGGHLADIAGADSRAIVSYSPGGWLMYMDKTCELRCVHLPTGRRIQTPSIASFPKIISGVRTDSQGQIIAYYIDEKVLPCDWLSWFYQRSIIIFPGSPPDHLPTTQYNCKQHSNEYVIFIAAHLGELAFARQGDTSWTILGARFQYHDIRSLIFCNGSLYAASSEGDRIYRIELNADLSFKSSAALPPNDFGSRIPESSQCEAHTYLVDIDDQLWLIWRLYRVSFLNAKEKENGPAREADDGKEDEQKHGSQHTMSTMEFQVFKLDERQAIWLQMEAIGEYAIFIGNNYPLALSTHNFPHLDRDCIYFTDDHQSDYDSRIQWDLGIYSLRDRSLRLNHDVLTSMDLPQPTWVMPFSVCNDP